MSITFKQTNPLFLREVDAPQVPLGAEDYLRRLALLRAGMAARGLDFCLVYGDREHFANRDYLSGYDCRFEEGLFLVPAAGAPTLLLGNEGMAYSYAVPYEINRVYYRNFSLQGQPRCKTETLAGIFRDAGIGGESRLGVIGWKYFLSGYDTADPEHTYDLPHYVMEAIFRVCPPERVVNATDLLTGLEGGVRLNVRSAREIAAAEAAAARTCNAVLRMLRAVKPGMTEYEVSQRAGIGFAPWCMYPMVNFGPEHVALGLCSPSDDTALRLGDPCGLCYGVRGSLSSRVGVAAWDRESMGEYAPLLESFYGKFFEALCAWYGALSIGVTGHTLHRAVHDIIGAPEYNVHLNVGHYIGGDEWVNSPVWEGSEHRLADGAYFQTDIIASGYGPVRTAICEDPVILAGPELRGALAAEYPQVYGRVMARREAMAELGIALHDEVLPLSNLNGAMFPFMLNLDTVFAVE